MSWDENKPNAGLDPAADAMLDEALKNFRESMQAWGEAAGSRQRTMVFVPARRNWRLAAGWALACTVVAGTLSGGIYDHQRKIAAQRAASEAEAQARLLAAEPRTQIADEDLLATLDNDISHTVPAAMEPLAQLMDEDQSPAADQ